MAELITKYQQYAEYKDSGVEWLGKVPSHWSISRLKRCLTNNDGGVWGEDPNGVDDTIVLRSTEQTADGHWKIKDPAIRNLNEHEKSSALLITDDLLLTKSSGSALHIGKTTIVTEDVSALICCYSNFMQRLRLNEKLKAKLAWYLLNSNLVREQFEYFSSTTTGLANLNASIISEVILPISSIKEQIQIINFLDHETAQIDTLIEKQQTLIKLLKEKRQAVISHAVTKGLNPNAPMKDSGVEWLGDVSEHWDLVPLKYLCNFSGGGTPTKDNLSYWTGGTIPWVSPKDMKSFWIDKTQDYITENAVKESSTKLVKAGALLMVVRSGILQRTIPIAINTVDVTMNQDMRALQFNERMSAEYAANYIMGNVDKLLFAWSKEGATVESIEHEYLSNSLLPVPPIEEQQRIVDKINEQMKVFDNLVMNAKKAIQLMQERRTALISAAVTGKIDVRGWVEFE